MGKTTIIGEANVVALITPMKDGMILLEQVFPVEDIREVRLKLKIQFKWIS